MKHDSLLRWFLAQMLLVLMAFGQTAAPPAQNPPAEKSEKEVLDGLLLKDYITLFEIADHSGVQKATIISVYDAKKTVYEAEKLRLEQVLKAAQQEEKYLEKELAQLGKSGTDKKSSQTAPPPMSTDEKRMQRKALHCKIYGARRKIADSAIELFRQEVTYNQNEAKLYLLAYWPEERARVLADIAAGSVAGEKRPHASVEDIGMRSICKDCDTEGQAKDMKLGAQAVAEMEQQDKFKYLDMPEVEEYVNRISQNLKNNSDVRIPLKVRVLDDKRIGVNAFSLPGGYFFVNKDLFLSLENESQLKGVIAHEIAHIAARHGAHMMRKAMWVNLARSLGMVAFYIFGQGLAYLVQYIIYYGMDFAMLGVIWKFSGISRENEAEADQLAVQWLWKEGSDPRGFTSAFSVLTREEVKHATEKIEKSKGMEKIDPKRTNPRSSGFLATHPAHYDRMRASEAEALYLEALDKREGREHPYVMDSTEFHVMQNLVRERDEKKQEEAKAKLQSGKKPPTLGPQNRQSQIEEEGCMVDGTISPDYKLPAEKPKKSIADEQMARPSDKKIPQEDPNKPASPSANPDDDPDRPVLRRKDTPPQKPEEQKSGDLQKQEEPKKQEEKK